MALELVGAVELGAWDRACVEVDKVLVLLMEAIAAREAHRFVIWLADALKLWLDVCRNLAKVMTLAGHALVVAELVKPASLLQSRAHEACLTFIAHWEAAHAVPTGVGLFGLVWLLPRILLHEESQHRGGVLVRCHVRPLLSPTHLRLGIRLSWLLLPGGHHRVVELVFGLVWLTIVFKVLLSYMPVDKGGLRELRTSHARNVRLLVLPSILLRGLLVVQKLLSHQVLVDFLLLVLRVYV